MKTIACEQATEKLLTSGIDLEQNSPEIAAALDHIKTCPHCRHKIGHLIPDLTLDEEDDPLTCPECDDLLPGYLVAEMNGEAESPLWKPVTQHLLACPSCAEAYTELCDLMILADEEPGLDPAQIPAPDLSFLPEAEAGDLPATSRPWRLNEWGRLLIQFSADLVQNWRQTFQQPGYAVTGLKSGDASGTLGQFTLDEGIDDLAVTITAEAEPDEASTCSITVEVNIPSRGGWPNLADTEVILKRDGAAAATEWTNAFGLVTFAGIVVDDLPRLAFEIAPDVEE